MFAAGTIRAVAGDGAGQVRGVSSTNRTPGREVPLGRGRGPMSSTQDETRALAGDSPARRDAVTTSALLASGVLWVCCGLSRSRFAPPELAFLSNWAWLEAAAAAQLLLVLLVGWVRAPVQTRVWLQRAAGALATLPGIAALGAVALACAEWGAPTHARVLAPVWVLAGLARARRLLHEEDRAAPTTDGFLAWVSCGGAAACGATVLVGALAGHSERAEVLAYFVVLGLTPAALAAGYPWLRERAGGLQALRLAHLAVLAGLCALWLAPELPVLAAAVGAWLAAMAAPLLSARARAACDPERLLGRTAEAAAPCVLPSLVVFGFTCWPYARALLYEQLTGSPWFAVGAGLGLAAVLPLRSLSCTAPQREGRGRRVGLGLAALGIAALFFDAHLRVDTIHYGAYLGPANAVLGGRVPLVDVHCQYGLGYLLYSLAFTVLPRSYEAAALVTTAVNVAFFALVLLNALQVTRSTRVALGGGALALFSYAGVLGYNFTTTPSVAGMRFLPLHLLVLAMLRLPAGRSHTPASLAALGLCAAWSVEALGFALGVYLLVTCARVLLLGGGLGDLARGLGVPLAASLGAFCLVSLVIRGWGGAWPRVLDSWAIVSAHLEVEGSAGWTWLIQPRSLSWLPLCLGSLGVSATTGLAILRRRRAPLSPERVQESCALFALAALSTAELSIFAMRTFGAILATVMLPGVVLLLALVDRGLRESAWRASTWSTLVAGIPLIAGFALTRLAEPVGPYEHTALLARTLISDPGELVDSLRKLAAPPAEHPDRARLHVGLGGGRGAFRSAELSEGLELLQKRTQPGDGVLLFSPQATPLLFLSGRVHAYPISNPVNDQLSPPLVRRILKSNPAPRAGQAVFVTRDLQALGGLQRALLLQVARAWVLEPVDLGHALEVYRLAPLPEGWRFNPAWDARLLVPLVR